MQLIDRTVVQTIFRLGYSCILGKSNTIRCANNFQADTVIVYNIKIYQDMMHQTI